MMLIRPARPTRPECATACSRRAGFHDRGARIDGSTDRGGTLAGRLGAPPWGSPERSSGRPVCILARGVDAPLSDLAVVARHRLLRGDCPGLDGRYPAVSR